jgi:hypothetical protein
MELHDMRQQVLAEMEHIPRHPKQHQSALRMAYWMLRMQSLGKKAKEKKAALQVLQESIESVRQWHPAFEPKYDEKFFGKKGSR